MASEPNSVAIAGLCGVMLVTLSIAIKIGAGYDVVLALTIGGALIVAGVYLSGGQKTKVTVVSSPLPHPVVPGKKLCKLTNANVGEITRKRDAALRKAGGIVIIELDKVLETLLNYLLKDVIEEYNAEEKVSTTQDQSWRRLTVGEKVGKLTKMLEKSDAAYTGAPSKSLPMIRDGLRSARNVRNKLAHDSDYDPPERILGKARMDYIEFFTNALKEFRD